MSLKPGLVSLSVTTGTGTYKDLADFNLVVENWPDLLTGVFREFAQAARPGRIDTASLSNDPTYKPAQFQIVGTVFARSSGWGMPSMLTDLRNLKGWCARATALKVSALDTSMFRNCKCVGFTAKDLGVVGSTPAMSVTMSFEGLDPLWYDTTLTTNNLTTSLSEQPLGTAPSFPIIRFTGAPAGLTLTYADSTGATVQTLTLADLETSGAAYTEIDMGRSSVVQSIGSVVVNAMRRLDPTTHFFALDPQHADVVTPTWCQLKYALDGGSVSGVTCSYRKRWY